MPPGTEQTAMKDVQKAKITLYWYVGGESRTHVRLERTFLDRHMGRFCTPVDYHGLRIK